MYFWKGILSFICIIYIEWSMNSNLGIIHDNPAAYQNLLWCSSWIFFIRAFQPLECFANCFPFGHMQGSHLVVCTFFHCKSNGKEVEGLLDVFLWPRLDFFFFFDKAGIQSLTSLKEHTFFWNSTRKMDKRHGNKEKVVHL